MNPTVSDENFHGMIDDLQTNPQMLEGMLVSLVATYVMYKLHPQAMEQSLDKPHERMLLERMEAIIQRIGKARSVDIFKLVTGSYGK